MTDVSRSAPPAPKAATPPAHTPALANRSPAGKAPEERGDVFSALLSLVAETRDIQTPPAGEAPADGSHEQADESAASTPDTLKANQDASLNPLAQLPGWADPQAAADRTSPGAAQHALATPANTPQTLRSGDDGTGLDITGMQPLATPQAINPATVPTDTKTSANIASLQPNAIPQTAEVPATVASTPASRSQGAVVPTPGAQGMSDARASSARRDAKAAAAAADSIASTTAGLRAPTTLWQPMTNASARGLAAANSSEALRGRVASWGNSTVSMDLSAAREADGVAGNAVSLTARLSAVLAGQAPAADGAAHSSLLGTTQEAGASATEGSPATELLPQGEAALEPEPAQISHWNTQQLRHAHLRLGEGALDSVDIRLSMQGQELSVDFRTDNADIRQSLAQQANQSLAVLLERSGIALADVSVGAQQPQHQHQRQLAGQHGESQRDRSVDEVGRSRAAARVQADASMALHAPPAQTLRADGSRPLDLFV